MTPYEKQNHEWWDILCERDLQGNPIIPVQEEEDVEYDEWGVKEEDLTN